MTIVVEGIPTVTLPTDALTLVGVAGAARLIGRTPAQLTALLDEGVLPDPLTRNPPRWSRRAFRIWALRMGWHVGGWQGQPVIGLTGLAHLTNRREQSLRKARMRHPGPDPVVYLRDGQQRFALYDPEPVLRWCAQVLRPQDDVSRTSG